MSKSRGQQQHHHHNQRHQSINQSINHSVTIITIVPGPCHSIFPFKPAGPGRCGTDPARFKHSLFPDRHQVISRQTAAVETKTHTHKRHTTDRNTETQSAAHAAHRAPSSLSWLFSPYCTLTRYSSHPHITHTTHHTTAYTRYVYLLCSTFACTHSPSSPSAFCCATCLHHRPGRTNTCTR